ncbi:hypothetical protein ACWGH2_16400 [Streptomyces sp. NPDC054871]
MSALVPSITAVAAQRIASSDDPDRFERIVTIDEAQARHDGVDLAAAADAAWNATDPIRLAAELEVLAGLRRIAAAAHPTSCSCDACRVRAYRRTTGHGGAH